MRPFAHKNWLWLLILVCVSASGCINVARGQQSDSWEEVGRIPVRYIDTSIFDATPSNWALTQDKKGVIYAGNNAGLLIYDGVSWEVLPVPGNIIRSLDFGHDDKVYIGSFAELGYLSSDSLGNPEYITLNDQLPASVDEFADVWSTSSFKNSIFFQTSDYLFRWKDNTMQVWEAASRFTNVIPLQDHILVSEPGKIFYVTEEDSLQELNVQGASLSFHREIISDGPKAFLAFTKEGLVRCRIEIESTSVCSIQETGVDDMLRTNRPFDMQRMPDGNLAIGFDGTGVALLDPDYQLLRVINSNDGLLNLEVMELFLDREGALWLALFDGLARIEPNNAWSTFTRTEGLPSQVNQITRWNGKLVTTTMLGIYELNPGTDQAPAHFSPIKGGGEFPACNKMAVIDATLLAACVGGLAEIRVVPNQPGIINPLYTSREDFRNILSDPSSSSVFYVTGDNGISKGELKNGTITLQHTEPFSPVTYELEWDPIQPISSSSRLWATAHPGLLYRIDIPHDGSPWKILHIDETHNLEGKLEDMFIWDDTLRAKTEQGMYDLHNSSSDIPAFKRNTRIGERDVFQMGIDHRGDTWAVVDDTMRVISVGPDGDYTFSPPSASSRIDLSDHSLFFEEPGGVLWFAHTRGIDRIVYQRNTQPSAQPTVSIRKVTSTSNDSLLYSDISRDKPNPIVPYNEASLRFDVASQVYDLPEQVRYRVKLEGLDKSWTKWTSEPHKEYTSLPEGEYTFHVQARNLAGVTSNVQTMSFLVLPPWHRTGWAYTLWTLLGALAFFGTVKMVNRYQTRRLHARNERLNALVAEQTEEIKAKNISLSVAYEEAQVINDNLVETNRILENSMDQLRDALEANKEILGITAHDLKNPLGGIIGLAEMVIHDFENGIHATYESAVDNLPMLKDEAERMLQIIKDLLDKHREGANTSLSKEKVLLGDIVSAVIRWNKKQAKNKGILLEYIAEENTLVDVDIMSIQRVLDNYVSNSIKYSPTDSRVWICVKREDAIVKVSVRDEGPGLTDEDKQKVFGKMQRLSATPTAGEHSTGLGLYIVKKLVKAHGGEVGVDSIHGQGATFWFTLPLVDVEEEHVYEKISLLAG